MDAVIRWGRNSDHPLGRLLLIDEGVESDACRWFFHAKELNLEIVKDAAAGLRQAKDNPPDAVVVSSIFGLDYIEDLVRTLKGDPATEQVRLIALVDSGDPIERVGADAIVIRPFHLEDLYEVILDQGHAGHS